MSSSSLSLTRRIALLLILLLPACSFGATIKQSIFSERNCTLCHNLNGEKVSGKGPAVSAMQQYNSLLDFGGRLWNHGPEFVQSMQALKAPIPKLEGKDIAGLISYITAFKFYSVDRSAVGDPARGEIVWKGLKCSACHSLEGASDKVGADLRKYQALTPVQMAQAMWEHGPQMAESMGEHGINTPRLTGGEMFDLLAYIRFRAGGEKRVISVEVGDPLRGADVFKSKNCISCHPVVDNGYRFGPVLERRQEYMDGMAGVAAVMWNHSVGMREQIAEARMPLPAFKGTEMSDLMAYLYISAFSEKPGDPLVGKKIFELKKCLGCHVATAGKVQRSALGIVASMWNHLPTMAQGNAASFPRIKQGEMKDLVAYLENTQLSAR